MPVAVLRERIAKLIDEARRRQRLLAVDTGLRDEAQFEGMIGKSAAMWETFARIRRVAPHFRTILVTGQTGTGKELCRARAAPAEPGFEGAICGAELLGGCRNAV